MSDLTMTRHEGGAPGFFHPGHVYWRGWWEFRCDSITAHPETSKRIARGRTRKGTSEWVAWSESEDAWADGWTDADASLAAPAPLCDCGAPIPADQRRAYCSDRCRWADQDHGPDVDTEPQGDES